MDLPILYSLRSTCYAGVHFPSRKRRLDDYDELPKLKGFYGPFLEFPNQNNGLNPMRESPPHSLRVFSKTAEIDKTDALSDRPDPVLLKIFSFLDRKSIDVMKRINQKMNSIANHSSVKKIKFGSFEMQIVQNQEGHAVHFRSNTPGNHSYVFFVKCLDLIKRPMSSGVLLDKPLRYYYRIFKYTGNNHQSLADYVHCNGVNHRNHETPVSRMLFTRVKWILSKYNCATFKFSNVMIDVSFVHHVRQSIDGMNNVTIIFEDAVIQPGLIDEYCRFLTPWMLSLSPRVISIVNTPLEGKGLFSEHFLLNMANNYNDYVLRVKSEHAEADLGRFIGQCVLVPKIARFHTLILHSLTINVKWLVEAFLTRMSIPRATGEWKFCVDGPFDPTIHVTREKLKFVEYEYAESLDCHLIRRKGSNNFVGFLVSSYQQGLFIVEAKFESNGQRQFNAKPFFPFGSEQKLHHTL